MIVVVGEILIDRFPSYERIGGAPFNFAFHLKKLGFSVRFFSRVGDDRHGRRIVARLGEHGFATDDIQVDRNHPTGTVQVDLDADGVPHFDIRRNVAYDHLALGTAVHGKAARQARMIYFGSLLQRTDPGCERVQAFLQQAGRQTTCFLDINMRPPHVNPRSLAASLVHADLLKLNEEELADLMLRLGGPTDAADSLAWLMDTYAIPILALTRGSHGSTFVSKDAQIDQPADRDGDIVDTVGAGDGYAAILAAGFLLRRPWPETIAQASRFAGGICRIPGAVPEDEGMYADVRRLMKGHFDDR
ncbi:PfkB domain protein [Desulfosarcina cetonica]|uniref:carbohydrate kinase family protein n=1 Tax=Desulfosarcina cetonica TaxID=90730 RepID=UPI0006D1984C|nr:carbohydrate kinase [Desulfosarcina cetonica]VTR64082.1 PfkB domain protein [Desulfosarcina cetonica]